MSFDFPASPSENQEYTPAGGPTYIFKSPRWMVKGIPGAIAEAPNDGKLYARKSLTWDDLTDDFAAKAPTTHTHAQADVTNLTTDLGLKAPLASPTFTGDPKAPTPTAGDSDTSIATTAFVSAALTTAAIPPATVVPLMDGVGAVGTTTKYAREDHKHPSDTSNEKLVNKGAASGYAPLDASSKVPAINLPAYVDDVVEYANLAAFPGTGATGIIYVALDTNKVYRWTGTVYVEISPSPGSTDSVPEGSTNLYFTTARASAAAPVQSVAGRTGAVVLTKADVGLGNVDNTSDAAKPVSTATQTALNLKADIAGPTFTGDAKAVTQAAGDNDTSIATTAFVQTAMQVAKVTVSDTAPATPTDASLWWESDTGLLFIRYNDGNTTQWVQIAASTA